MYRHRAHARVAAKQNLWTMDHRSELRLDELAPGNVTYEPDTERSKRI